jgi:hypothetical protein
MASLWDLINGYSQGGAPSEGSTQTLGQAARDIYRGLINPQQLQEVQRATQRTQKVIPSVLESLARGSIAQVPGTAGDISALLRQLAPQTTQQVLGNRIAPTTDEILGYVPRMTPNYQGSESHEMMGGLLSPALGYFTKAIPTQMTGMPIGLSIKNVESPFVPGVNVGEEMFVQHNLTPEKLYDVEKLGGLPVPSLAISKTKNPLENFGDITLIGNKNMAIPSKENPIYTADAYTVRKPHIVTQTDRKADDFITNKLAEHYGELKNHKDTYRDVSGYGDNLDYNLQDSVLLKMQYLKEKGLLPDSKKYESPSEFRMAVRNVFDNLPHNKQSPFYDWQIDYIDKLKKEAQEAGGTIKSLLYKGRSNTTGKQLYEPATIENIVKRMSAKNAGAEGNGNLFTAGSLRAKLTPKLKTETDILKNRSKIISESESQQLKDDLNSTHEYLIEDLSKFLKENNSRIDERSFLEELALGTANKYEYSRDIAKKVPADLLTRIKDYANELKKAPTDYFEIKPKRAVQLNEFAGAIVPKETTEKTLSILEKNGIRNVYKYSSPKERKQLVKKFGKEFFVGIPLIATAEYDNNLGLK